MVPAERPAARNINHITSGDDQFQRGQLGRTIHEPPARLYAQESCLNMLPPTAHSVKNPDHDLPSFWLSGQAAVLDSCVNRGLPPELGLLKFPDRFRPYRRLALDLLLVSAMLSRWLPPFGCSTAGLSTPPRSDNSAL